MRYAERRSSLPTLEAHGIVKRFGAFVALWDVSLSIHPGEVTALAGPNGAGKTTLFHILNGNLRPDRGRVTLDGADVTGLAPWRMARLGIGRMFQDVRAFGDLTARENVAAALSVGSDRRAEADRWLAAAGLSHRAETRARDLPLADRRMLALARLMALRPRLLLLDEPMAGLPETETGRIAAFIRETSGERGIAVALIEHDLPKVKLLADTVCFLHEGRVMKTGTPDDVFADPNIRELYQVRGGTDGRATGGDVRTGSIGVALDENGRIRPGVSLLRREGNVFPSLSVADNLALAAWTLPRTAAAGRRAQALKIFPFLSERLSQRAGTLSGGQRQALAIAMVMCRDARVYFFDEPSAGLAPKTAATMLDAIAAFAAAEPDREVWISQGTKT